MNISTNVETNIKNFKEWLHTDRNFDIVYRTVRIRNTSACMFFVDGFAKDEIISRVLDSFAKVTDDSLLRDAHTFSKNCTPYGEIGLESNVDKLITGILSGQIIFMIDGMDQALVVDARTYPQRVTSEPEKDKVFRGSHDGFVETLILNTALIRRRIRTPDFCVQHVAVGDLSKTDIAVCYLDGKADQKLLNKILERLRGAKLDALTMNQESVAEILIPGKWLNPFPKFKYTERPDTTASQILEGDIAILVDNSPSAIIVPTSFFHVVEEANDYYFPPLTGTYLRLSRLGILLVTVFLTPVWLLLTQYPDIVPEWMKFILVTDDISVPLIFQLLILELAIDGLKIASLNTPNMLNTSLSIVAAIIVGDYAVQSGWFSPQALLYEAFVTMANFSQPGFELGYALKFMRMGILILTGLFQVWGFIIGTVLSFLIVLFNKTLSGRSYLYPLIPWNWNILKRHLFRAKLNNDQKK